MARKGAEALFYRPAPCEIAAKLRRMAEVTVLGEPTRNEAIRGAHMRKRARE